jgi:hypothetical protein
MKPLSLTIKIPEVTIAMPFAWSDFQYGKIIARSAIPFAASVLSIARKENTQKHTALKFAASLKQVISKIAASK